MSDQRSDQQQNNQQGNQSGVYRLTSDQRRAAGAATRQDMAGATCALATGCAYDGEHLGALVFDLRHVTAGHPGLWVYPAAYTDAELCQRRADNLAESFGVPFYAVPLTRRNSDVGWYAVTGASSTATLRAHIQRAYDVARALAPRNERNERTERTERTEQEG